ncbi:MAG: hypothetical protein AAFR11_03955 [Pseudomonadota bacterium]
MLKSLRIFAIAAFAGLAPFTSADAQHRRDPAVPTAAYGFISLGGALIDDAELSLSETRFGFAGPQTDDVSFSSGFVFGAGLGVYIPRTPLSIEGESLFIQGSDIKGVEFLDAVLPEDGPLSAETGRLDAPTVLGFANLVVEQSVLGGVHAWAGVGAGFGSTEYRLSQSGLVALALEEAESYAFAYQLKAGVDVDLVRRDNGAGTSVGVGYRRIAIPNNKINVSIGGIGEGRYTYAYEANIFDLRVKTTF